jgi:hypothetical protein
MLLISILSLLKINLFEKWKCADKQKKATDSPSSSQKQVRHPITPLVPQNKLRSHLNAQITHL